MPRGSAVIRYAGKRGIVWRIKYADADGRQIMETVGRESDGWTRAKACEVLAERLVDVRREGLRRPAEVTVAEFARQWLATYPQTKRLKKSTTDGYTTIIETHLIPRIGDRAGRGARRGHRGAVRRRLHGRRPLRRVSEPPPQPAQPDRESSPPQALAPRQPGRTRRPPTRAAETVAHPDPAEVAAVRRAFHQLEQTAEPDARAWVAQAAAVFTTVYGTGIRRGELLGLRWRHVRLADPEGPTLRVEETYVRNRVETPKSERSARTIPLGPSSRTPSLSTEPAPPMPVTATACSAIR